MNALEKEKRMELLCTQWFLKVNPNLQIENSKFLEARILRAVNMYSGKDAIDVSVEIIQRVVDATVEKWCAQHRTVWFKDGLPYHGKELGYTLRYHTDRLFLSPSLELMLFLQGKSGVVFYTEQHPKVRYWAGDPGWSEDLTFPRSMRKDSMEETIAKLICENTGRRINLTEREYYELQDFARAVHGLSR